MSDKVSPARRADLDWLRVLAFGLLILYHAGMAWSGWSWHVTSPDSINKAVADATATFGTIDVLVNNAGIGVVGAFEATPMTTVREVFETNTA